MEYSLYFREKKKLPAGCPPSLRSFPLRWEATRDRLADRLSVRQDMERRHPDRLIQQLFFSKSPSPDSQYLE